MIERIEYQDAENGFTVARLAREQPEAGADVAGQSRLRPPSVAPQGR